MQNQYSNMQLDALKEVSNIGVGNAATSLSRLIGHKIDITVPAVNVVEFNKMLEESGEKLVAGIVVRVIGDIPGNILIIFEEKGARKIIEMLTGQIEEEPSEMGISVLCEIGNILSASYMNSITKFTDLAAIPSVPAVSYDMMGAILATSFMEAGQFDEYILDIETVFLKNDNDDFGAHFYYIPVPGSIEKILNKIGIN